MSILTKLYVDSIERSLIEGGADEGVGENALRSRSDVDLLSRAGRKRAKLVHECGVVRWSSALDVEVDAARFQHVTRDSSMIGAHTHREQHCQTA